MDIAQNTPFDPTAANNGTFTWGGGEGTNLVVINESFQNLFFKFAGGQISYVPANDRRRYSLIGEMAQAQNQVRWFVQSSIKNQNTINQVVVEVYAPGEEVPESYPAPVIRQSNVAGNITATSLSLIQPEWVSGPDVNVISVTDPNTLLVYASLNTHPSLHMMTNTLSPAVALWDGGVNGAFNTQITNQGQFIAGSLGNFQGHLVVNNNVTGNPNGDQFFVDGITMTVPGQINANLIRAIVPNNNSGQDLGLHTEAGFRIVSTIEGTGDVFAVSAAGPTLLLGTLNLLVGSLSKIAAFGPYSVTTTAAFFNHNLGVIPDAIILTHSVASSVAFDPSYDHASMTATQVKLQSVATGTLRGLAIKF